MEPLTFLLFQQLTGPVQTSVEICGNILLFLPSGEPEKKLLQNHIGALFYMVVLFCFGLWYNIWYTSDDNTR